MNWVLPRSMAANTAMDAIYSGAATAMQTILMAQIWVGFVGPRSVPAGPLACTPWALMWTMLFMFFLEQMQSVLIARTP